MLQEEATASAQGTQKTWLGRIRLGSTWFAEGDSWQTVRDIFDRNKHKCSQVSIARGILALGRSYQGTSPEERQALVDDGLLDR